MKTVNEPCLDCAERYHRAALDAVRLRRMLMRVLGVIEAQTSEQEKVLAEVEATGDTHHNALTGRVNALRELRGLVAVEVAPLFPPDAPEDGK